MTDLTGENIEALTARTVDYILDRSGALILTSQEVRRIGVFEGTDRLTGESVRVLFDKDNNALQEVSVWLADPTRHLVFDAEGRVDRTYAKDGHTTLFSFGGLNPELSPKERRQAIGYIATAGALIEDIIDTSQDTVR